MEHSGKTTLPLFGYMTKAKITLNKLVIDKKMIY